MTTTQCYLNGGIGGNRPGGDLREFQRAVILTDDSCTPKSAEPFIETGTPDAGTTHDDATSVIVISISADTVLHR